MMEFHSDPYVAEQQMRAVIFCLVAFAYIDEDFDNNEKKFIRDYIGRLCEQRARVMMGEIPADDIVERWVKHYSEILDEYDGAVREHFSESVASGETSHGFVTSRLKLGCFEVLSHFDEAGQTAVLSAVDELMHADGKIHPNEAAFRQDLLELIHTPIELDDDDLLIMQEGEVVIDLQKPLAAKLTNHPFLAHFEWDFAHDPATFQTQSTAEMRLIDDVIATLDEKRKRAAGKLSGATTFASFRGEEPFLDGHVHVVPPVANRELDILVLGDLHGCYSCLKAALLQHDFLDKVERYKRRPDQNPVPYVVVLGDYIDRGKFSYTGTLRTVMQLFLQMPDHVFVLRGNHEYYVQIRGKVVAPVRPCEAMDSIAGLAANDLFAAYMRLFEALPNSLILGQLFFVHGGIPRSDTLAEKWEGIHSLNDKDIRFQMLWSDPSDADAVPCELQKQSARFPFGRKQFQQFMAKLGCTTMIRGHERIVDGFKALYTEPEGMLLSLFSAGGADNRDLPPRSNYRKVTPKALNIVYVDGVATLRPFELDWASYQDADTNAFFKTD